MRCTAAIENRARCRKFLTVIALVGVILAGLSQSDQAIGASRRRDPVKIEKVGTHAGFEYRGGALGMTIAPFKVVLNQTEPGNPKEVTWVVHNTGDTAICVKIHQWRKDTESSGSARGTNDPYLNPADIFEFFNFETRTIAAHDTVEFVAVTKNLSWFKRRRGYSFDFHVSLPPAALTSMDFPGPSRDFHPDLVIEKP